MIYKLTVRLGLVVDTPKSSMCRIVSCGDTELEKKLDVTCLDGNGILEEKGRVSTCT